MQIAVLLNDNIIYYILLLDVKQIVNNLKCTFYQVTNICYFILGLFTTYKSSAIITECDAVEYDHRPTQQINRPFK